MKRSAVSRRALLAHCPHLKFSEGGSFLVPIRREVEPHLAPGMYLGLPRYKLSLNGEKMEVSPVGVTGESTLFIIEVDANCALLS
jgi:hypothetical protein